MIQVVIEGRRLVSALPPLTVYRRSILKRAIDTIEAKSYCGPYDPSVSSALPLFIQHEVKR